MTTELIENETSALVELSIRRPPAVVLEEARQAAVALKAVIDAKPNKVMMNNEQYLEFEDWQTVAKFYGVSVKTMETKPIQLGPVSGFEASAVAFHVASGKEVSRAEAMCLNDEEKWSMRNKYEWVYSKKSGGYSVDDPGAAELIWVDNPKKRGGKMPKKERILIGQEAVPLFQLRSMAQTRACAKALRNALAWVVVLAGYKPTPAEELPRAETVPNVQQHELETTKLAQKEPVQEDGSGHACETARMEPTKATPQQTTDASAPISSAEEDSMEERVILWNNRLQRCVTANETNTLWQTIPDPIKQNCYPAYSEKMKTFGKKKA